MMIPYQFADKLVLWDGPGWYGERVIWLGSPLPRGTVVRVGGNRRPCRMDVWLSHADEWRDKACV